MNLFFDTSSLVKYFYDEEGTDIVTSLIESENKIYISEIAKIEFSCSLYRKFRNKELSEQNLTIALEFFNQTLETFHIEPVSMSIMKDAETLIHEYGKNYAIRTLDSIHVASFLSLAEGDWKFIASDKSLLHFIKSIKINHLEVN